MDKTKGLSDEARILDDFLKQYRVCINRKHALEAREQDIIREFDMPLNALVNDGIPRGSGENLGAASLPLQLDEIQIRIKESIKECTKAYLKVDDVISYLGENTTERTILERKYIDRQSWADICKMEMLSKTPATQYWRNGLYTLLEFARVQMIVMEHKKIMEKRIYG